jgi:hypothetical protein
MMMSWFEDKGKRSSRQSQKCTKAWRLVFIAWFSMSD